MCEWNGKVPLGPVKPIYIHDNHFEYDDDHHPDVEFMISVKIAIQNNDVQTESNSE